MEWKGPINLNNLGIGGLLWVGLEEMILESQIGLPAWLVLLGEVNEAPGHRSFFTACARRRARRSEPDKI